MNKIIPSPVISVVAKICADRETHASLNNLFGYADAPGDPPDENKLNKAQEWLRRVNKEHPDPLLVLGKLIENYMESPDSNFLTAEKEAFNKQEIAGILERHNLQYHVGGVISDLVGNAVSKTLKSLIKELDIPAMDLEFKRALENVNKSPREAVSAASNILETICKVYIDEKNLEKPQKQDLKSIWSTVRKDLGFDPKRLEDTDLQTILTGLFALIEGIGSLRTHASSAHGPDKKSYKLEARHSRLAVHSAHTAAVFILETWERNNKLNLENNTPNS